MIIEEQPKKSIPKNKKVQTCTDITSQKLANETIAHTLHDVMGNGNRFTLSLALIIKLFKLLM